MPFFSASASGFDEKYVGVGAQRVRALFAAARRAAPAIVFIDEIDCVGSAREQGGERNVHAQTLNALLVEMDGFAQNAGLVVLAATNQVGSLDAALRRPGRFDRIIHVPPPDIGGRRRLLARLAEKLPLVRVRAPSSTTYSTRRRCALRPSVPRRRGLSKLAAAGPHSCPLALRLILTLAQAPALPLARALALPGGPHASRCLPSQVALA